MSLLTNQQIAELVGIASNQSTSKDLHSEFHEWNEKQTGVQVKEQALRILKLLSGLEKYEEEDDAPN